MPTRPELVEGKLDWQLEMISHLQKKTDVPQKSSPSTPPVLPTQVELVEAKLAAAKELISYLQKKTDVLQKLFQAAEKECVDIATEKFFLLKNLQVHVLEHLVDRFKNAHMLNCMAGHYLVLCRLREHLPKEIQTTVCLFDWTSVQTHARDKIRQYESELDRIAPDKLHELRSQGLVEFDSSLGSVMQPDFPMMPAASRRRS